MLLGIWKVRFSPLARWLLCESTCTSFLTREPSKTKVIARPLVSVVCTGTRLQSAVVRAKIFSKYLSSLLIDHRYAQTNLIAKRARNLAVLGEYSPYKVTNEDSQSVLLIPEITFIEIGFHPLHVQLSCPGTSRVDETQLY